MNKCEVRRMPVDAMNVECPKNDAKIQPGKKNEEKNNQGGDILDIDGAKLNSLLRGSTTSTSISSSTSSPLMNWIRFSIFLTFFCGTCMMS